QRCIRFSPDGSRLLSAGRMGEICVWRMDTGEHIAELRDPRRRVFTAAFSADGTQITSVGDDRRMIRYDLATSRPALSREVAPSKLMSMCLINDDMVAAAGADNAIHLVDLRAGGVIANLEGH